MASITLHVPAGLVETIHDELERYRDVKFDVLASRPASDDSSEQQDAANLVRAIDRVVAAVPWDDLHPDQPIDLTADNLLLLEIVYGALLGLADRLVAECHRGSAGTFDRDIVAEQLDKLNTLVGFHARTYSAR
jgi:hypothetical protein